MKEAPKISVIIPVYNAELYLKRCIDSVLNQSFKSFEIIAIDDGSKDNSFKILNEYQQFSPNIRTLSRENKGAAYTRNEGIKLAKGEFIMFIDSDDYINPDYLQVFYDEISSGIDDAVIGGLQRVNQEGKQLFSIQLGKDKWSKYRSISPCARIYRKKFLQDNNLHFPEFPLGEDLLFSLKVYSKSKNINTISYCGYFWFYNENSASNTLNKGFNPDVNIIDILTEISKIIPKDYYELDLIKFFIKKFTLYWLLDGGRNSSSDEFLSQYKKINEWVINHDMKSKISVLNPKIKSERLIVKVAIVFTDLLNRFKLMKLFSKVYCKGHIKNKK